MKSILLAASAALLLIPPAYAQDQPVVSTRRYASYAPSVCVLALKKSGQEAINDRCYQLRVSASDESINLSFGSSDGGRFVFVVPIHYAGTAKVPVSHMAIFGPSGKMEAHGPVNVGDCEWSNRKHTILQCSGAIGSPNNSAMFTGTAIMKSDAPSDFIRVFSNR